jgi:D-alanyl-D-alanine carboxypeptidase (penicillin-binding protein 5/6)
MKKHLAEHLVVFIAAFCFLLSAGAANAVQSAAKKKHRAANAAATCARAADEEPFKAYIVMEATSGKVLEEQNSHERRAPASMAKLMTACIVLEKVAGGELHLTDKVPVSRKASKIGGSQVYLKEGESFTLEEMMRALMIASANDAAYAISELIAGSSKGFVDLMNEKAKTLGMNDTEFASVHGLPPSKDQKEDVTSCYDMAVLAREVLKYPKILEWTSTKTGDFRNGTFILNNHNKLLSRMPEVDGLKTGYYRSTGYNVAATAKKGDIRFITVVMGSPTARARDNLAVEKLKKYFGEYTVINVARKGEQVDKAVVLDDGLYRTVKGVAAADLSVTVMRSRKKDLKRMVNVPSSVKGEVKQGQKIGEVVYELDNAVVGKVDIVSPVFVPKANIFTRMVRRAGLNI